MIYTIGYGHRTLDELLAALDAHGVEVLADVRSAPYSRYRPEFSRDPLRAAATRHGLRYVFWGDLLGGRPRDESCYRDGAVDYELVRATEWFARGLARLHAESGRVCLLCAEARPETCHRALLVGAALADAGVAVGHVDADGTLLSQADVERRRTGGQLGLF